MTRKPSFAFERRERAKGKTAKRAEKAKAKAEKKTSEKDTDSPEAPDTVVETHADE